MKDNRRGGNTSKNIIRVSNKRRGDGKKTRGGINLKNLSQTPSPGLPGVGGGAYKGWGRWLAPEGEVACPRRGDAPTAHQDHNTHEHASHREKEKSGWFGRGSTSYFQSQSAAAKPPSIGLKVTGGTAKVIYGVGDCP
jgi:hypothetical protein